LKKTEKPKWLRELTLEILNKQARENEPAPIVELGHLRLVVSENTPQDQQNGP